MNKMSWPEAAVYITLIVACAVVAVAFLYYMLRD